MAWAFCATCPKDIVQHCMCPCALSLSREGVPVTISAMNPFASLFSTKTWLENRLFSSRVAAESRDSEDANLDFLFPFQDHLQRGFGQSRVRSGFFILTDHGRLLAQVLPRVSLLHTIIAWIVAANSLSAHIERRAQRLDLPTGLHQAIVVRDVWLREIV